MADIQQIIDEVRNLETKGTELFEYVSGRFQEWDNAVNEAITRLDNRIKLDVIFNGNTGNEGTLKTTQDMTNYDFIVVLYDLGGNEWNKTEIVPKDVIQTNGVYHFLNVDNPALSDASSHSESSYFKFFDDKTLMEFRIGTRWADDNKIKKIWGVKLS